MRNFSQITVSINFIPIVGYQRFNSSPGYKRSYSVAWHLIGGVKTNGIQSTGD